MRRVHLLARFAAALLLAFLVSCGSQTATMDDFNTRQVTLPNGKVIKAELAVTQEMMARGLMFRTSMPNDRGMLFFHETEGRWQYWMLNTKIPLDIIWMDNNHRVVEISANTPPCHTEAIKCPNYGGNADSRYVLELNAGEAKRNDIRVGETISF